jgi:hypothetical protein
VLRSALENHYTDFCRFAEKLDAEIAREEKLPISLREDRLWSALKQHLPRSPLWSYFNRWDELHQELAGLEKDIEKRLTDTLKSDSRLKQILSGGGEGIIPGIVAALAFQMKSWARGHKGLTLENNFRAEPAGEGLVNVHYGLAYMDRVNKDHLMIIRQILGDFELKVVDWEEYSHLQKLFGELERLKRNARDELAVITLRRVVPGRCRYCPI